MRNSVSGSPLNRPRPGAGRASRSTRREAKPGSGHDGTLSDRFMDAVILAAEQAGCDMLFEIPAFLLDSDAERAAAVSCGPGGEIFFILFDAAQGKILVITASEVPRSVIGFARSYAGVLGLIASDRDLVAPLLQ
jgi:hypothetical protein